METLDKIGSCESFRSNYGPAFFGMVCSEDLSAERVLRQLYPGGPKCASCGAPIVGTRAMKTFWAGDRTHCAACGCKFSPRAGTILADSKLSYSQFEIIVVCLSLGLDHHRIAPLASVHVDTVTAWARRIAFWESHV